MKKKKLEIDIEKGFVSTAERLGVMAIKYNDKKRRGGPDRLVVSPFAPAYFVEFKRPGEKPRPAQAEYHRKLKSKGYEVQIHDDLQESVLALFEYVERFLKCPLPPVPIKNK